MLQMSKSISIGFEACTEFIIECIIKMLYPDLGVYLGTFGFYGAL